MAKISITGSIARIVVARDPETVAVDWDRLAQTATGSVYQSRAWVTAWLAAFTHDANPRGGRGAIIVAYDAASEPLMLLALVLERAGGFVRAQFCGGKDANYNMALVRPDFAPDASEITHMLQMARRQMQPQPDIFSLTNQPEAFGGRPNLLAQLPHQASPSFGHCAPLQSDGAAFIASVMSKDSQKKLRRKQSRLGEIGAVTFGMAQTAHEIDECLRAFYVQKAERMHAMGLEDSFASAAMQAFLGDLSSQGRQSGVLQWYFLKCDGRIIATYAGGIWRGRFHGMVNSFDADPLYATTSPGNLLLHWLVQDCCTRGLRWFDLGTGEARYKSDYCEIDEALFDLVLPVSGKGLLIAKAEQGRLHLKRAIKQSPALWSMVKALRSRLKGGGTR
ncbi:MAG: GNAT family N-acetyltransferase [Hyphomicrobiales bacterium]|nr:GNAT family N-acetyltransferase [Hyphomicrobiales bacterium]MDE2113946.1 GNAT family N-acetyltransferase [Hyphomicrobiales bacterium]